MIDNRRLGFSGFVESLSRKKPTNDQSRVEIWFDENRFISDLGPFLSMGKQKANWQTKRKRIHVENALRLNSMKSDSLIGESSKRKGQRNQNKALFRSRVKSRRSNSVAGRVCLKINPDWMSVVSTILEGRSSVSLQPESRSKASNYRF